MTGEAQMSRIKERLVKAELACNEIFSVRQQRQDIDAAV